MLKSCFLRGSSSTLVDGLMVPRAIQAVQSQLNVELCLLQVEEHTTPKDPIDNAQAAEIKERV